MSQKRFVQCCLCTNKGELQDMTTIVRFPNVRGLFCGLACLNRYEDLQIAMPNLDYKAYLKNSLIHLANS